MSVEDTQHEFYQVRKLDNHNKPDPGWKQYECHKCGFVCYRYAKTNWWGEDARDAIVSFYPTDVETNPPPCKSEALLG